MGGGGKKWLRNTRLEVFDYFIFHLRCDIFVIQKSVKKI